MVCWKLVRDKIPEKIEKREDIVVREYRDPRDKDLLLRAKIVEEAAELASTGSVEEAADLLEALIEWLKTVGVSLEELEGIREEKKKKLGGFSKGYVVFWLDREDC